MLKWFIVLGPEIGQDDLANDITGLSDKYKNKYTNQTPCFQTWGTLKNNNNKPHSEIML